MSNHIHLIVYPQTESSLQNTMRDTHSAYASWFNKKYDFVGHLWQSRYYSSVLDDVHLRAAVRYVERNPVRAAMVKRATDYPWSSALPHAQGINDRYLDDGLPFMDEITDWEEWLSLEDDGHLKLIRESTSKGRPCGSQAFVDQLMVQLGRELPKKRRGRPPLSSTSS